MFQTTPPPYTHEIVMNWIMMREVTGVMCERLLYEGCKLWRQTGYLQTTRNNFSTPLLFV